MPQDDIDQIPSIVPSREGVSGRRTSPQGGDKNRRRADRQGRKAEAPKVRRGAGPLASFLILVALAAAGGAGWLAWQLQLQMDKTQEIQRDYENRIADLEARLSDTDEGMTQNAAVQAAKIKELDSEVRKLWDNVWKKTKARLDKLEASSGTQGKSLAAAEKSISGIETELADVSEDIGKLNSVSGDLSRLMSSAKANQAEVERVADTLNRIDLDLAKLAKRVESNEEWVGSINAFRRQINTTLNELQGSVAALQAPPQ